MDLHPDFRDLLAEFAREKVSYAVVGGYAVDATLARAVHATLGDLTVPILALDDLIANKRAAGRAQDLADLALLEKVRSRK